MEASDFWIKRVRHNAGVQYDADVVSAVVPAVCHKFEYSVFLATKARVSQHVLGAVTKGRAVLALCYFEQSR